MSLARFSNHWIAAVDRRLDVDKNVGSVCEYEFLPHGDKQILLAVAVMAPSCVEEIDKWRDRLLRVTEQANRILMHPFARQLFYNRWSESVAILLWIKGALALVLTTCRDKAPASWSESLCHVCKLLEQQGAVPSELSAFADECMTMLEHDVPGPEEKLRGFLENPE